MKVEHIAIWAKDIERLRQFYETYFEASSNAKYMNLETGQSATVDAPLAMELITNGGSFWITDLVSHESDAVHCLMWERYGEYLCSIGGADYRPKVFEYIEKEDSPKPVTYQSDLLRKVGFKHIDLLHKNSCLAAFGAVKQLGGQGLISD